MNVEHLVALINNAVRFYPTQSLKCLQPQTHAHINNDSDLSSPNLGKIMCDHNRPYFFSRLWDNKNYNPSELSWEYPLAVTFENAADLKYLYTDRQETTYNFQLSVVDSLQQVANQVNCSGCTGRVIHEYYRDTEIMLLKILSYLDKVNVYLVDGELIPYNEGHWEYMIANDLIEGEIDDNASTSFRNNLRQDNVQRAFHRIEANSINRLLGSSTTIRFTIRNCQKVDFRFEHGKNNIPDKGCC